MAPARLRICNRIGAERRQTTALIQIDPYRELRLASPRTKSGMNYNFCRTHKPLRVTPAMAAGVMDRVWDINDLAALIAAQEASVAKRGQYKKRAA